VSKVAGIKKMEERALNLRGELHTLIGLRERLEKRNSFMPNPETERKLKKAEEEVEEFLEKHPELKDQVETIEDHFTKKLYE
jgi:thiamine kinase-like enzyme